VGEAQVVLPIIQSVPNMERFFMFLSVKCCTIFFAQHYKTKMQEAPFKGSGIGAIMKAEGRG
jgi:hypothetical protein